MLKFFRKIRQNLLMENKIGKYFKYAIGEIILVMIGILLALQINNSNEQKKEDKLETTYYCKIKEDLESDKIRIENIVTANENRSVIGKKLLFELHSTKEDKGTLTTNLLRTVRSDVFYPNKSAINDITSSGKLSILKNASIKKDILNYYTELENLQRIISENQKEVVDRLFAYGNVLELGVQFTFYSEEFGEDLMALLPDVNWHLDKNSNYFKKFEEHVGIAVIISARENEILNSLISKIELLTKRLDQECLKQ